MAKREELLGYGEPGTTGVVVPWSKATAGGVAKAVVGGADAEVRLGKPLLPLQDPWNCSTSLFPTFGAFEVSPPGVPKKWILKGEAASHETV